MKLSILSAVLTLSLALAPTFSSACEGEEHAEGGAKKSKPTLTMTEAGAKKVVFQVNGMSCGGCEKKIQASLLKINGVKGVTFKKAGQKSGMGAGPRVAEITLDGKETIAPAVLAQAVQDAGYQAVLPQ